MKVTKYPQSCLIIEKDGSRLLIDPGSFVSQKYDAEDLLPVDAILITHEHSDHVTPGFLSRLVASSEIPVIANASTARLLGDKVTRVVQDGQEFELAGFKVVARELPHVAMADGSPGPQNTGYVIDGTFFHPGDGVELAGLTVDILAVPVAGPDVSPRDAFDFIRQIGCHTVIPIHYDAFPADPWQFESMGKTIVPEVKFVVLASGQSADL